MKLILQYCIYGIFINLANIQGKYLTYSWDNRDWLYLRLLPSSITLACVAFLCPLKKKQVSLCCRVGRDGTLVSSESITKKR